MYMYMYVYMYVYMCMYIVVYMYMYVCLYMCMYIVVYICLYVCIYVCVSIYLSICIYLSILYVSIYLYYMYLSIYIVCMYMQGHLSFLLLSFIFFCCSFIGCVRSGLNSGSNTWIGWTGSTATLAIAHVLRSNHLFHQLVHRYRSFSDQTSFDWETPWNHCFYSKQNCCWIRSKYIDVERVFAYFGHWWSWFGLVFWLWWRFAQDNVLLAQSLSSSSHVGHTDYGMDHVILYIYFTIRIFMLTINTII